MNGQVFRWSTASGFFDGLVRSVGIVSVVLLTVSMAARADDDLDRQLLESLEQEGTPDSPVKIVNRILGNTESAGRRLEVGKYDQQTTSMQQQIVADIDLLLAQSGSSPPPQGTSPPTSPRSPASAPDQQEGTEAAQDASTPAAGEQGGQASNDPNAASRESAERTTRGGENASDRERRLGLATAAWGHLPPKVREQMRSAFSETYLPKYDELVRKYYEALAARREREERSALTPTP